MIQTEARAGDEIATAFNCRKDGSCRQLLRQVSRSGQVIAFENRYFLPGTIVDPETGAVLSGLGEAKHWMQAFTRAELVSLLLYKLKRLVGVN